MRKTLIICACIAGIVFPVTADKGFPEWRGSNVLIEGEWAASDIIAVGDVTDVKSYGEQAIDRLPMPMSPEVHRLYWCQGRFLNMATIKGELAARESNYVWASAIPGCAVDTATRLADRTKTRVWFLRREGALLRPTFDAGTHGFIRLFVEWTGSGQEGPRHRLGRLLLEPSANAETLEDYADYLWSVGNIARELLGASECAKIVRDLANSPNSALANSACNYLKAELGQECFLAGPPRARPATDGK